MASARNGRWRSSAAAIALACLATSDPGSTAPVPEARFVASNCVPGRAVRADRRFYRRFHVLPRLYDRWRASDCYPRRVDDAGLARSASAKGLMVPVNGRDAVIVDVDGSWVDACVPGRPGGARLEETSGADVLELRDRIARAASLRDVDVLEIGLGRAFTTTGTRLQAILIGTHERSVRLQCYEELEPMIEQAARIFRDDRETVDGFYDFLTIERSNEDVALGAQRR